LGVMDGIPRGLLDRIAIKQEESVKVAEVVFFRDKELEKRWKCSGMKLWRMRKAGILNSIKIGGTGGWLTSDAEIARIEAPPDIKAKPRPCVSPQGTGPIDKTEHPLNSDSPELAQASMKNGGA
jgi:hypothetical protein